MKPESVSKQMQETREQNEFKARILPGNKSIKCPHCDQPHGLWYRMGSKDKKSLLYTCNKQKQFWYTEGGVEHWKYVTRSFESPVFIDGLPLFVDWSPQKRTEYAKKNQHQLAIPLPPKK